MLDKLNTFLSTITTYIQLSFTKAHDRWQKEQKLQQQQQLHACLCSMTDQMSVDLYHAFVGHNYHLGVIETPRSIRFRSYKKTGSQYLYYFSIDKKSTEKILPCILSETQRKMNLDIASAQRTLLKLYGVEYLYCTHPFLYHGIYVMSVQDTQQTEVALIVQTHLTPQVFLQNYY